MGYRVTGSVLKDFTGYQVPGYKIKNNIKIHKNLRCKRFIFYPYILKRTYQTLILRFRN